MPLVAVVCQQELMVVWPLVLPHLQVLGIDGAAGAPQLNADGLGLVGPGDQRPGAGGPAAGDLAFARAKDREGAISSAALRNLRGMMTATGQAGGGNERSAMASLTGATAGRLNDVSTAQALEEARRGQQVEDRNYMGDLTRRGQNIGFMGGVINQRPRTNLY